MKSASKFLSLVLRHKPQEIGLTLDPEGWANLDQLVQLANTKGWALTRELVVEIVASSDKQRFALSADRQKIRANQGHSIAIQLGLEPQAPPRELFHGTATRFLQSIREQGLIPGSRQHVHLSQTTATALTVGARHGKPIVISVDTGSMQRDGFEFFLSANGVWLTAAVPAKYLAIPNPR